MGMYVCWAFGVGGVLANIIIYQQKNRKALLTAKLTADILWTAHYSLLGAWSGAAVCGIGILRETVFLNKHKKWADSNLWLALFFLLSIVSAIFTWKNVFSILPACASALSIISFWIGKPRLSRVLQVPISTAFLCYNIASLSYTGIANEVLILLSVAVAWLRNSVKMTDSKVD